MQFSIYPVIFQVWSDPAWVNILRIILILFVGWVLHIVGLLEFVALYFLISFVWKSSALRLDDEITWAELGEVYDNGAGSPPRRFFFHFINLTCDSQLLLPPRCGERQRSD